MNRKTAIIAASVFMALFTAPDVSGQGLFPSSYIHTELKGAAQ